MKFGADIPFVNLLGFELEHFGDGESAIRLDPRPEHQNSFGVVHGGVCMTLLDVSMALAARSVQADSGAITIEMKTTFMQGANGPLTGRGKLIHRTRNLAFAEATILDAEGRKCAHATGTFKYVPREKSATLLTD